MKKEKLILSVFIIAIISINFISAAQIQQDIERFALEVGDTINAIFGPLLGTSPGSELLSVRISFLIITFIIIFLALDNVDLFNSNKPARVVVTSVISLLSARYVSNIGIIRSMLLPYTGFFTALLSIAIPTGVVVLLHKIVNTGIIRRMIIGLFGIMYSFFWYGASYSGQDISHLVAGLTLTVLFLGFVFDGWIQDSMRAGLHNRAGEEIRQRAIQSWLQQLHIAQQNGDAHRVKVVKSELRRRFGIRA